MKSKHTSDITNSDGYLLRDRAGWEVPIGSEPAGQLGADLTDREIQILLEVEQLGYATTEQLARAFFNNHRSAYDTLLRLVNHRMLANLGADALLVHRAVGHRPPPRNPTYILDWNGYYYLTSHRGYHLHNWRASTVARPSSRFGHAIGISEVWSHLLAAARATQELDHVPEHEDLWRYRLAVHFRNERASRLIHRHMLTTDEELALLTSSAGADGTDGPPHRHGQRSASVKGRVLLQPDGAFEFSILELSARPGVEAGIEGEAFGHPFCEGTGRLSRADRVTHPRWDPALNSWEDALLHSHPSRRVMLESEEMAKKGAGGTYYRTLLLEMETGANSPQDVQDKISIYNRLIRTGEEAWTNAYGVAPRVLVVVRNDAQIKSQAGIWRARYVYKKGTAVLLTSLQSLARVSGSGNHSENYRGLSGAGRRALLGERCWLDVMATKPAWKTLGEALKVGSIGRKHEAEV